MTGRKLCFRSIWCHCRYLMDNFILLLEFHLWIFALTFFFFFGKEIIGASFWTMAVLKECVIDPKLWYQQYLNILTDAWWYLIDICAYSISMLKPYHSYWFFTLTLESITWHSLNASFIFRFIVWASICGRTIECALPFHLSLHCMDDLETR